MPTEPVADARIVETTPKYRYPQSPRPVQTKTHSTSWWGSHPGYGVPAPVSVRQLARVVASGRLTPTAHTLQLSHRLLMSLALVVPRAQRLQVRHVMVVTAADVVAVRGHGLAAQARVVQQRLAAEARPR